MDLKEIRLLPDKPEGWLWWPAFEARVKNFCEKYTPNTDPVSLAWDLRQRFITTPNFTGYWLVLDEKERPVAHMVSWLANTYAHNYIFVLQAEADDKLKITDAVERVCAGVDSWAKDLNKNLKPEHHINRAEMCTFRDAKVWERYLRQIGRSSVQLRSVISFDLNVKDMVE